MKSEAVTFPIKSAYGKDLPKELSGSFTVEVFENRSEIPDGKRLNDDQYVAAVNAREKAKLRAKATTEALDAAAKTWTGPEGEVNPYSKPDPNSEPVVREQMLKSLMKLHGLSEEVAKQVLAATDAAAASVKQQASA